MSAIKSSCCSTALLTISDVVAETHKSLSLEVVDGTGVPAFKDVEAELDEESIFCLSMA